MYIAINLYIDVSDDRWTCLVICCSTRTCAMMVARASLDQLTQRNMHICRTHEAMAVARCWGPAIADARKYKEDEARYKFKSFKS